MGEQGAGAGDLGGVGAVVFGDLGFGGADVCCVLVMCFLGFCGLWLVARKEVVEGDVDLQSQFARSGQRSLRTSMLRRPWEVWRITRGTC